VLGVNPKEQSLGGDRASSGLNHPTVAADRRPDQSPEGEATGVGATEETRRQTTMVNDRRARVVDETIRPGGGNKPLKG